MSEFEQLRAKIDQFAKDRDWDKFHSPKNLSMALSVEVAELLEQFQWPSEEESAGLKPSRSLADHHSFLLWARQNPSLARYNKYVTIRL